MGLQAVGYPLIAPGWEELASWYRSCRTRLYTPAPGVLKEGPPPLGCLQLCFWGPQSSQHSVTTTVLVRVVVSERMSKGYHPISTRHRGQVKGHGEG